MEKFLIQEWGIVGVIVFLFIGMISFLKSQLLNKLNEVEEICMVDAEAAGGGLHDEQRLHVLCVCRLQRTNCLSNKQ